MSTEIEFRHVAIRLERAGLEAIKNIARHIDWKFHYRLNDDHYMVFVEHGSNNTIDMRGRVARHWSLYAAGTAGDCMNVPIEYASGVHGGCTRFAKGRGTLPETYIAYYRQSDRF